MIDVVVPVLVIVGAVVALVVSPQDGARHAKGVGNAPIVGPRPRGRDRDYGAGVRGRRPVLRSSVAAPAGSGGDNPGPAHRAGLRRLVFGGPWRWACLECSRPAIEHEAGRYELACELVGPGDHHIYRPGWIR